MRKILKYMLLFVFGLLVSQVWMVQVRAEENLVNIYFFHSKDCGHCKSERVLLDRLDEDYSQVKIYKYEVSEEKTRDILDVVKDIYQIRTDGVPITIIGDKVYIGYNEEKSKIKFIKTIEYYSRYGYQDRLGEALQIDMLPRYRIEEDNVDLDEFMDTYQNYHIIGNLDTDGMDTSMISLLLGMLSMINIFSVVGIIIVLATLTKVAGVRNKFVILLNYLVIDFLFLISYVCANDNITLVIEIVTSVLFMINILKYYKSRNRLTLIQNGFIVLAILINFLEFRFSGRYINILNSVLSLHKLTGLDKVIYYFNYIGVIIFGNILLVLIIYFIIKKVIKK